MAISTDRARFPSGLLKGLGLLICKIRVCRLEWTQQSRILFLFLSFLYIFICLQVTQESSVPVMCSASWLTLTAALLTNTPAKPLQSCVA